MTSKGDDKMDTTRERIYNAVQKDYATFLKTASETNGEYTLLEVELAPQGGNDLHAHGDFTEEFKVLEGELGVQVGQNHMILKSGESALVPRDTAHRFYSTSDKLAIFQVELRPGHQGFEQALRIAYKTADLKMSPLKNMLLLGLLVEISGTKPTELAFLFKPIFKLLATIAKWRGLDKELNAQYGQP
jgi:quercetin dioxygenase-like cupin family protein